MPYWLYFKANACVREGRYEEAIAFARRSVEAQPGYAGAWVALANGLGQLVRFDEARLASERAPLANPSMMPEHLAAQIRILAGGRGELAESSPSGLRAAGLLS